MAEPYHEFVRVTERNIERARIESLAIERWDREQIAHWRLGPSPRYRERTNRCKLRCECCSGHCP